MHSLTHTVCIVWVQLAPREAVVGMSSFLFLLVLYTLFCILVPSPSLTHSLKLTHSLSSSLPSHSLTPPSLTPSFSPTLRPSLPPSLPPSVNISLLSLPSLSFNGISFEVIWSMSRNVAGALPLYDLYCRGNHCTHLYHIMSMSIWTYSTYTLYE